MTTGPRRTLPSGGTDGALLRRNVDADGQVEWVDPDEVGAQIAGVVPESALGVSVATLVGGKVPNSQLPALAINDTYVVNGQAAMLALLAQQGDIAVRTDLSKSLILAGTDPTVLGNWQELLTPVDTVQSVAGKVGTVTLAKGDVGLGSVDNTADAGKPVSTAQATAIASAQAAAVAAAATAGNGTFAPLSEPKATAAIGIAAALAIAFGG